MATLITDDGQLEFNGILLGDNVDTFMDELTGWDDLPPVDSGNSPIPMYHGSYSGAKFARERIVTWTGVFNPEDESTWLDKLREIRRATTISATEKLLTIRTLDEELQAYASVTARSIPNDRRFGAARLANIAIQFTCSDPRRYSTTTSTLAIGLPDAGSGGLTYPLTYPLTYGTGTSSNSGSFNNEGDAPIPAIYTLNGPIDIPVINLQSDAGTRHISFTITLADGEFLRINTADGTVLLNDTADRLYTRVFSSAPLKNMELDPGVNMITVNAGSWDTSLGASLTVSAPAAAYF